MSTSTEKLSPSMIRLNVDFRDGWHPSGPKTSWFTSWTEQDWTDGTSLRATVRMFQARGIAEAPRLKEAVLVGPPVVVLRVTRRRDEGDVRVSSEVVKGKGPVWKCDNYSLSVELVLLVDGQTKRFNPALSPKRRSDGSTTLFSATNVTTIDDRDVKVQVKLKITLRDDREPPVWWDRSRHPSAGLPSLGKHRRH